jgi:uncharacterized protein YbcI
MKTKGEIEAEIGQAIVQFEIDYMGRGPKETRAHIVEDLVVVRLKGVLTPAEEQLTRSLDGKELVKKMRATLIDKARPLLYQVVGDITGMKILDLHTDISTESGERVFVFSLENNLQRSLGRKTESEDFPRGWFGRALTSRAMGRPQKRKFPVGLFYWLKFRSEARVNKGGIGMNSSTYVITGVILILLGVVGIYYIRHAPGTALFASMGLIAGIAMIGKATKKF